jgi:hypothetical protein
VIFSFWVGTNGTRASVLKSCAEEKFKGFAFCLDDQHFCFELL